MPLGTALVGFNVLALVMALVPYRRYERWAWFALWLLPLQWVSEFVFLPEVTSPGARGAHRGWTGLALPRGSSLARRSPLG